MEIMSTTYLVFLAKVIFIVVSLALLKAAAFRLRYGIWGTKPQTEESQIINGMEIVIILLLLERDRNVWLIILGVFVLSYIPTIVNFVFSRLSSKN